MSIFFTFQFLSFYLSPGTLIHIRHLIFSVGKKLNDFSNFIDFRHFFVLQLISINIVQYWEFAREPFPKLLLITVSCKFLPGLVLFSIDFLPLNIILLLMFFL